MKNRIRVVLLEKVAGVGVPGDIVTVAEGYARNLLFPAGKAALATEAVTKKKQQADRQQRAEAAQALQARQTKAEQLEGTELRLTEKIKEGTELYAKVTTKQIATELNKQAHLAVKAKDVGLEKAITETGSYDVTVNLSPDVSTTIRVTVDGAE